MSTRIYQTKSLAIISVLRMHGFEPISYELDTKIDPGFDAPATIANFDLIPEVNVILTDLRAGQLLVSPFNFTNVLSETRKQLMETRRVVLLDRAQAEGVN